MYREEKRQIRGYIYIYACMFVCLYYAGLLRLRPNGTLNRIEYDSLDAIETNLAIEAPP